MSFNSHVVALLALTTGIGYVMALAGTSKNALEWRRRRRICPSCGRDTSACGC
jgi:hypothetical protein